MTKVPLTMQMQSGENGAATLHMILGAYKKFLPYDEVRSHTATSRNATSVDQLCAAADYFDLETNVHDTFTLEELRQLKLPLIVQRGRAYSIVTKIKSDTVKISDASKGEYELTTDAFLKKFTKAAIEIGPNADFKPGGKPVSTLSVLFNRISRYKADVLKTLIINIVLVCLSTFMMLLSKQMMDNVIGNGDMLYWLPLLLSMIAVLIVQTIISISNTLSILKASRNNSAESGSELYNTVLNLPMLFYESHYAGDISGRINANMKIDQDLLKKIVPELINAVVMLIYLGVMYLYSPLIAGIFTFVELLYIIVMFCIRKKTGIITKSISYSENNMSSSTLNGVNMIETIKTSGAERSFFTSWSESQNEYDASRTQLVKLDSLTSGISTAHKLLTTGLLLFLSAVLILHGNLTLGIFTILQSLMNTIQSNLSQVIKLSGDAQSMRTDIERADDILNRKTEERVELTGDAYKLDGSISIKNLYFRYSEGDEYVVKNFNLDIAPGEAIALVGHTGCGKSTVIKILTGLYTPSSGEVLYGGQRLQDIPTDIRTSSVSVVDQESMTFNDTISANIKLWDNTISDYTMVQASKDARIYTSIVERHGGFETKIMENGRNFSGGEIQRIEIARAFTHEPSIMILDEFTSALDVVTEKEVFDSISKRQATSVVAVHRLSSIMKCDRVVVMEKGEIIEIGDPEVLVNQDSAFAKLIGKGKETA